MMRRWILAGMTAVSCLLATASLAQTGSQDLRNSLLPWLEKNPLGEIGINLSAKFDCAHSTQNSIHMGKGTLNLAWKNEKSEESSRKIEFEIFEAAPRIQLLLGLQSQRSEIVQASLEFKADPECRQTPLQFQFTSTSNPRSKSGEFWDESTIESLAKQYAPFIVRSPSSSLDPFKNLPLAVTYEWQQGPQECALQYFIFFSAKNSQFSTPLTPAQIHFLPVSLGFDCLTLAPTFNSPRHFSGRFLKDSSHPLISPARMQASSLMQGHLWVPQSVKSEKQPFSDGPEWKLLRFMPWLFGLNDQLAKTDRSPYRSENYLYMFLDWTNPKKPLARLPAQHPLNLSFHGQPSSNVSMMITPPFSAEASTQQGFFAIPLTSQLINALNNETIAGTISFKAESPGSLNPSERWEVLSPTFFILLQQPRKSFRLLTSKEITRHFRCFHNSPPAQSSIQFDSNSNQLVSLSEITCSFGK